MMELPHRPPVELLRPLFTGIRTIPRHSKATPPPTAAPESKPPRPPAGRPPRTHINVEVPDGLVQQLDGWREERHIWSRNDAILQLVRFVVAQPWPLGNAAPLDAAGNVLPNHPSSRTYPVHQWTTFEPWATPGRFLQLNVPMDLLTELDEWRNERRIWSRVEAIRQILRYGVHQPWPGGNGPPDGARAKRIALGKAKPDPLTRRYDDSS